MNKAEELLYQVYKSQRELVEFGLAKMDTLTNRERQLVLDVKEANETLDIGRPIYKLRYELEKKNGNTTNSESNCGRGTQYH